MRHASLSPRLFLVGALVLLLATAFASPSPTFGGGPAVVTKEADTADGTCDADCSLREAIIFANAAPREITLPAGTYTLSLDDTVEENDSLTGDLDLNAALTINGDGADTTIIDGAALNRVFHVRAPAVVTITGVTVRNGLDGFGAGIYIAGGALTLNNSAVTDNTTKVSGTGGGIWNQSTLTVTNSTISDNTATGGVGGGLYNFSIGTSTLTNSTVSGNTAMFGAGGIFNGTPGVTTLTNVTVSDNTITTADGGGGIRKDGQGGSVILKNTIVANGGIGGNCFGSITSNGHNLDDDASCALNGTGDLGDNDAKLLPLTLNAPGTTETHALLPDSAAIDNGSPDCPPPNTDQRRVDRPLGFACDIGAYEYDPRGDTNCDGLVNGLDLVDVLSDVANVGTPPDCLPNGDVDGDSNITELDALLIVQYWAGAITEWPVGN